MKPQRDYVDETQDASARGGVLLDGTPEGIQREARMVENVIAKEGLVRVAIAGLACKSHPVASWDGIHDEQVGLGLPARIRLVLVGLVIADGKETVKIHPEMVAIEDVGLDPVLEMRHRSGYLSVSVGIVAGLKLGRNHDLVDEVLEGVEGVGELGGRPGEDFLKGHGDGGGHDGQGKLGGVW